MHTPSDETELEYQSAESPWIAIQPPVLARINGAWHVAEETDVSSISNAF